ncbi:hypothetical protein KIW84_031718 [Lathyrus oleraceus]|uniref:Uncharacterized protein n=1 Tax=Pisum sativum TaxID=3888 RepID=A0A9D4XT51_PEA|nr:hypothetical protein KIW84_031718 [Pisum sativum]
MRFEGIRRGSVTLGYFDVDAGNAITRAISSHTLRRGHGSAQVLVVHTNFIAVGMTKELIILVPSKYSIHHADNTDGKMLMLGIQGDRSHAPVTSMFFNQQGDLLLAGYVVRLSPSLEVYAQLSRPNGIRESSMPYTAWKHMPQTCSSAENMSAEAVERVSLLAIAWERKVQVARLVKSELKVYGEWSLDSAAIGLAWLDDQMLVVLTSTGQLNLFVEDGTVIHQTSFGVIH